MLPLGSRKANLQAKIFGGACVLDAFRGKDDHLGAKNVRFALELLSGEGIRVVAQDVKIDFDDEAVAFRVAERLTSAAGIAAIEDTGHQQRSREHNTKWLDWLTVEIGKLGLKVTPPHAALLLVMGTLALLACLGSRAALIFSSLTAFGWAALTVVCAFKAAHHAPGVLGFDPRDSFLYGALSAYNLVTSFLLAFALLSYRRRS